ncbi:MAG TPA: antitoxin VbhA family protein [Candidatus Dormibacteraeota bacterium]|nr:antitoxin VbhA family protein [Candidatus Dormibacteraeota bacterium]
MNSSTKKREKTVKQAIANEKLEGLKVSRETAKIADSYVTGKVSAKSVAAKIRARYGTL